MKAILENMPDKNQTTNNQDEAIDWILIAILDNIVTAYNREQLSHMMEYTRKYRTCKNYRFDDLFLYGFGCSHMWVKQLINGEPKQQLIFVQL